MKRHFSPEGLSVPQRYRFATQSTIPRAIGLISTTDTDGVYNLAPMSSYTIATQEPFTVVFVISVNKNQEKKERKDTLANIEAMGEFVVNAVTVDIVERVQCAAGSFAATADEFAECGLTPENAQVVRAPLVMESPINIECALHALVPLGGGGEGSGAVVVGEVAYMHLDEELSDENGNISSEKLNPIGRVGGGRYDNGGYTTIRPEDFFRCN